MADREGRRRKRNRNRGQGPSRAELKAREERRRRERMRERLEEMSPAQRKRFIAQRKRKQRRKSMLRTVFTLLLFAAAVWAAFALGKGKSGNANTEEQSTIGQSKMGLPNAGAGHRNESTALDGSPAADILSPPGEAVLLENGPYEGAVDISALLVPGAPLSVTKGQAAIDLSLVEGSSIQKVHAAKQAMAQASYFQGTMQTVDSYMRAYGEGDWHGIQDVSGDVCVFYDGVREGVQQPLGADGEQLEPVYTEVPFRVVFTVYEDGSFQVIEAYEDGALIDDYEAFLSEIVK